MIDYISPEEHRDRMGSCVGARLLKLEFSGSGGWTLTFDNGVEIEVSDGYCYSMKDGEMPGHGTCYGTEDGEPITFEVKP